MELKQRAQIAPEYKWRLEDIYETPEAWEAEFAEASEEIARFAELEKTLAPEAGKLLAVLKAESRLSQKLDRLYPYARMRRDEDSRVASAQALADRAQTLSVRASAATAFLRPALLSMPENFLEECLKTPDFADFSRYLSDVLRSRPHTLPAAQEALLAEAGEIGGAPGNIYTMLTEADLKFPEIVGEDGEKIGVTDARLPRLLRSRDARVRREGYETVMGGYGALGNAFAAIYAASVKNDVFRARARKFGSALEASLFRSEIPTSVYGALLDAVEGKLPALARYLEVKREALGLPEMHLWDMYVDVEAGFELKLPYEEARALVLEALSPLGDAYTGALKNARGWVDAMESEGKHHGAYSWGCYGVHPFVMMNFDGTLDSASTLAHELGHAMHSDLANAAQPFEKADYSLFCAEVASTVNEVLLSCHLLEKFPEKAAQRSLIGTLLEHFRTTVFRQSLFAAFERETHAMAERGEALTREALCDAYYALNARYYGAACVVDDAARNEWMRIPHFYRAFYVYQYATGFCAAVSIARRILRESAPAVEGYKAFLRAGGSVTPLDALRLAGVDMETPAPVSEALTWFEEMIEKYAAIR